MKSKIRGDSFRETVLTHSPPLFEIGELVEINAPKSILHKKRYFVCNCYYQYYWYVDFLMIFIDYNLV